MDDKTFIEKVDRLYCDGGCIGPNPSVLGGTWAIRLLHGEDILYEAAGHILVEESGMETVSNNLTEMLALVNGLEILPEDWIGTVYSDSLITLGRAFKEYKWNNIPLWLFQRFGRAVARLKNWAVIDWVLLQGHPTKKELAAGIGSKGYPVSIHNVWCDKACNLVSENFRKYIMPPLEEENGNATVARVDA